MSKTLTIHDIARLAGVSAMTVSRALNQPNRVSPAMRSKVQEVVRQTGFIPNGMAGGLRSSRAKLVAAVLPTLVGPVFQETIQALNEALDAKGYQLMIGQSGYDIGREDALLDAIIRRRPDGIVLTGIMHSAAGRRQLLASGIPVVETWDLTPTPIDMLVGFSNEEIGAAACAYLHQRGYRRPALMCGDDERARRRNSGFKNMARSRGWTNDVPVVLTPAPTTLGAGRSGLAELLNRPDPIDSVFCSSDMLALGVLIEAQARGLSIPKQLAVMGLGDIGFAANLEPALTTVRIDGTRIGQTAAQYIVDRANGLPIEQPILDIGFSIIERDST
ncbi:LacI family DNA-binding transcriptional regulator [Rhodoferax sp. PAMC 29310]|uniref:LacI family DNA-binding transcriptional regulator n=1 Tax=Rhodoferax sp. PAMC 29310 TaxID=2822760 RepID=UPI001B321845|nr:LacI family DNA-binding transcriptional regulator [Rhodoferax sp. PAMC 29310]